MLLYLFFSEYQNLEYGKRPGNWQSLHKSKQVNIISHEGKEKINIDKDNPSNDTLLVSNFKKLFSEDEIRLWQAEKRGYYYAGAVPSDYDDYNLDTLKTMGEQGNLKALDMLAYKYVSSFDYKNARKVYKKSAARGSTYALVRLATMEFDSSSSTVKESDVRSLNALAYLQAGILRGDTQLLMDASATIKYFPRQLTEEDNTFIRRKGLQIYRQLEAERTKLGLPNYENTVPEYALEYYKSNIYYIENSPLQVLSYFSVPTPLSE